MGRVQAIVPLYVFGQYCRNKKYIYLSICNGNLVNALSWAKAGLEGLTWRERTSAVSSAHLPPSPPSPVLGEGEERVS